MSDFWGPETGGDGRAPESPASADAGLFQSYVSRSSAEPPPPGTPLWGGDSVELDDDASAGAVASASASAGAGASVGVGAAGDGPVNTVSSTLPGASGTADPAPVTGRGRVSTFGSDSDLVAFPEPPKNRRFTAAAAALLIGFPLLYVLGATVGRSAMESDLRRTSIRALQQKGYAKDVEVSFSGRDATLTGAVETNAEVADIARVVAARNGVRSVSKGGLKVARPDLVDTPAKPTGGSDGTATTVAAAPADTKGTAATAADVSKLPALEVKFHDGNMELRGSLADAKARSALLDRIGATFEKEAIVSKLQLTGGKSSKGELAAYASIGSFLADLPRLGVQDADLTLDGGLFTFNGRVATAPDAKRLEAAMIEVVGSQANVKGRVTVSNRVGATSSTAAGSTAPVPTTIATGAPTTSTAGTATTVAGPVGAADVGAINASVKSVLTTQSITFLPNDSRLAPQGLAAVDAVADAIGSNQVSIEVRGYTDDKGSPSGNIRISQRRAQAVKDRLVQKGISSRAISARGLGEADPVADNATVDGQAKNRRIEIDVTPRA